MHESFSFDKVEGGAYHKSLSELTPFFNAACQGIQIFVEKLQINYN